MKTQNISEALSWGTNFLRKKYIEDPRLEAEILLAYTLNLKRIDLITREHNNLETEKLGIFQEYINRRAHHEPTAYIIGIQPFMSLDFFVDRSVLIPRPETEQLVELVSQVTGRESRVVIADVGTGSGAIAVSLAKNLPNAKVIGIDSSPDAIKIAEKNAKCHKVDDRCQFIVGNMFEFFNVAANFSSPYKFDVIISNPPYIPSGIIETLQPEVKNWEPREALDGGEDGLDYIRKLIEEGPKYLKENGYLILEFGIGQAEKIRELAKDFKEIKIIKDNSGIERVFLGYM